MAQADDAGLVPCAQGTLVMLSQCTNNTGCLAKAPNTFTVLDFGSVGTQGGFTLGLDRVSAGGGPLLFEAEIHQAQVATPTTYRTLSFGAAGGGNFGALISRGTIDPSTGAAGASPTPLGIVIDPSSEGSVNAIGLAGLENVAPDDPDKLTVQVRVDPRTAGYAGMDPTHAAELATEIASDLFFLEPRFIAASASNVYIADRALGAVGVLRREADGRHSFVEVQHNSVAGLERLDDPTALALSPDESHVYVTSDSSDSILVFDRDAMDGSLTPRQVVDVSLPPISADSPQAVVVSPDGANVYVSTPGNRVARFARDAVDGTLMFCDIIPSYVDPAQPILTFPSMVVSDDGKHLYGATGIGGAAIFTRNPSSGALTFEEVAGNPTNPTGVSVRQVVISPDDRNVYSLTRGIGANEDRLVVYDRNPSTRTLTPRQILDPAIVLANVSSTGEFYSVAISPDGALVYASTYFPTRVLRIVAFFRDQSTGALGGFSVVTHDLGGSLISAVVSDKPILSKLAISPDGAFLYTFGAFQDPNNRILRATAVFDRDPDTRVLLTFRQNARAFFVRPATATTTPSVTPTRTRTVTPIATITQTRTVTPGRPTPISTPTPTHTGTRTPSATITRTPTQAPCGLSAPACNGSCPFRQQCQSSRGECSCVPIF